MKRPSKRHRRWLKDIQSIDDDGVMFHKLAGMPGVVRACCESGFHGFVEATMADGKNLFSSYRSEDDFYSRERDAAYRVLIRAHRYWRRRGRKKKYPIYSREKAA